MDDPSVDILGSRVHLVSTVRTVDHMERWIRARDGQCKRVVVTGFHGLWLAHEDAQLRNVLNGAELWAPDGIAAVWAARARGHRHVERATGEAIMREYFRRAHERGYSSFFYGDTDATLSALRVALMREYPRHKIAGMFSPPFRTLTPDEDRAIVERINDTRPDVLWVGLGMPKQELWIYEHLDRLQVPVAIGVGAAFSFVAGTVSRCPEWIGRLGFEWVYRLFREPKKLWRRDLLAGPRFLIKVGLELFRDQPND